MEDRRVLDIVSVNISEGGLAFRCSEFLAKGAVIKLELVFYHKNKPVKVRSFAKVIFNVTLSDNQGVMVGANFTQMPEEDKQRLEVLINRLKN